MNDRIIFLDFDGVLNTEHYQNFLYYERKVWQDEEGTRKMFVEECDSRCFYNACIALDAPMLKGGYFKHKKNK